MFWRVKRDDLYLGPYGWTRKPRLDGFVFYMLGPARALASQHSGAKVIRCRDRTTMPNVKSELSSVIEEIQTAVKELQTVKKLDDSTARECEIASAIVSLEQALRDLKQLRTEIHS